MNIGSNRRFCHTCLRSEATNLCQGTGPEVNPESWTKLDGFTMSET